MEDAVQSNGELRVTFIIGSNQKVKSYVGKSKKQRELAIYRKADLDKANKNWHQMRASSTQILEVFVGSWNVGNSTPPDDLSAWIPKDEFDIYVIGSQGCDERVLVREELAAAARALSLSSIEHVHSTEHCVP